MCRREVIIHRVMTFDFPSSPLVIFETANLRFSVCKGTSIFANKTSIFDLKTIIFDTCYFNIYIHLNTSYNYI